MYIYMYIYIYWKYSLIYIYMYICIYIYILRFINQQILFRGATLLGWFEGKMRGNMVPNYASLVQGCVVVRGDGPKEQKS